MMGKTSPTTTKKTSSRVYVLFTGGTFGMMPDETLPHQPLITMDMEVLKIALPTARSLVPGVEITFDRLDCLIDSSSMRPEGWLEIALRIERNYNTHDGFVIIHGTDTLAYTSSALSFLFENLAKPVVVTGAQRPLLFEGSDALGNYTNALKLAGYKATGLPCVSEVSVLFGERILRGCRARKMRTDTDSCFDSPNYPPLGHIDEYIHLFTDRFVSKEKSKSSLQIAQGFNPHVADITIHPGLDAPQLSHLLSMRNLKGVILRTYGAGNVPADPEFLRALSEGLGDKIAVAISQCAYGEVEMGLYATSLELINSGVIPGADMTPEAALVKLMILLECVQDEPVPEERIYQLMQTNIRGELSSPSISLEQ